MAEKREYNGLVWIDASSPTPKEVRSLIAEYKIHPAAGEELLSPTRKPRVDVYDDHLHLILHFPTSGKNLSTGVTEEIDFVLGKNFLLTVHYDAVEHLRKFAKAFEVGALRDHGESGAHAGHLFAHLLKSLYGSFLRELERIESTLIAIEKNVFEENSREVVSKLSIVGRELLAMRQTTRLHHSILESLGAAGSKLFEEDFAHSIREASEGYQRVCEAIESNKELLTELRTTSDSLLSAKQNEVIRTLTIISFAILPLALIAAIFTLDVPNKPFSDSPHGFYGVLLLMFLMLAGIVSYFKYRKWI